MFRSVKVFQKEFVEDDTPLPHHGRKRIIVQCNCKFYDVRLHVRSLCFSLGVEIMMCSYGAKKILNVFLVGTIARSLGRLFLWN